MSTSARTVLLFGWYLAGLGVLLVAAPNLMLAISFLPATDQIWLRVVGVLVLCLADYYIAALRAEARAGV